MNGILCINKPQGFTSFDVVAKLRGILKTRKIGHAGTLDPMATGVLPVFVGNATKACDIMPDSSKSYRASFRLGEQTDTQDSTGTVLRTSDVACTEKDIEKLLAEATSKKGKKSRLFQSSFFMTCSHRADTDRFAWKSGFHGLSLCINSDALTYNIYRDIYYL